MHGPALYIHIAVHTCMYNVDMVSVSHTYRSSFQRKWYWSRVILKTVLKSKAFDFFDFSVHAVNLIFLMSVHFPASYPRYDFALRKCTIQVYGSM